MTPTDWVYEDSDNLSDRRAVLFCHKKIRVTQSFHDSVRLASCQLPVSVDRTTLVSSAGAQEKLAMAMP